jgi:hypothetical protein
MAERFSQVNDVPVVARDDALGAATAAGRATEPGGFRLAAVFGGSLLLVWLAFSVARALAAAEPSASQSPWAVLSSVMLGVAVTLLIGSIVEWVVHRWIMHRPTRLPGLRLAYEHHHRAHHWINFPPDQYIQAGPVQYVPLWGGRLDRVATSRLAWAITVASHFAFYAVFALPTAVLPAWGWTGNTAFAASVTLTAIVLLVMFIRVHDAMHYPGLSPLLERMAFFRWLDHHHYIHHIDTGANTNFLLPLGDVLLGTWRRELTEPERRRWPSYEEARRRLVTPQFTAEGVRIRPARSAMPA